MKYTMRVHHVAVTKNTSQRALDDWIFEYQAHFWNNRQQIVPWIGIIIVASKLQEPIKHVLMKRSRKLWC